MMADQAPDEAVGGAGDLAGMGPESKSSEWAAAKTVGDMGAGARRRVAGPEPGPPSDANATAKYRSPPLRPTNPPMTLFRNLCW